MFVAQIVGDVAAHYAVGESFHDGCFSCSRFSYEYGVVLGASAEYLQYAPYLFVASYHGVELAALCRFV